LTGDIDLVHFTNGTAVPNKARKNVVTVHDLAFIKFPETIESKNLNFLSRFVPKSIKNADHIIAVSENTKKDIMDYYNYPSEKISVIYNGISESFLSMPSESFKIKTKHKYNLKKPFLLSVNTIEPRKNLSSLISAYARLNKNLRNSYDLVICGGIGWNGEFKKLKQLISDNGLSQSVKLLEFVDTDSLKAIYSMATLYITPSLYEGFGLGLVEAMGYSLPIIASDIACHHEIGKNACVYFSPTDIQELSLKIELLLIDKDKYNDLKNNGEKRVKLFSWKMSAEKTLEVYKKVLLGY
jgi:glycosyltransferase involved in cell wall biosynthesis